MASYLKALNLTSGVEEVLTKIETDGTGSLSLLGGLNAVINISNPTDFFINIKNSSFTTEDLNLYIENTKSTLENGDILVYNTTNDTFKIDNISDVIVKNNKSFKNVFLLGGM